MIGGLSYFSSRAMIAHTDQLTTRHRRESTMSTIKLETSFGTLTFDSMADVIEYRNSVQGSNQVPPSSSKPKEAPKDRRIEFGRDGVSRISFMESDLRGNARAIFFAKAMKLLMVEYKKTSVDAFYILTNYRTSNLSAMAGRHRGRGWGSFILYVSNHSYYNGDNFTETETNLRKFLISETVRSASNFNNLEKIIADMKL